MKRDFALQEKQTTSRGLNNNKLILNIKHVHYNTHQRPQKLWKRPWASNQIPKIVGCACAGNAGNVSNAT